MTEKQYGGVTGRGTDNVTKAHQMNNVPLSKPKEVSVNSKSQKESKSEGKDYEKFIKAGKISSEVKKYARTFIKKDIFLLEIAEKIESKIIEMGAKIAFPTNLSIDEIAAHDTPSFNDTRKAQGLLKVDIGVQIDGCVADSAFSMDLENSEENKKLIQAAEKAVEEGCKTINAGVKIRNIGAAIEKAIKSLGFTPIQNLSGHSIEPYTLHAGITIPNVDNSQEKTIEEGVYAIEPFSTNGLGRVKDGKPSGIYRLERDGHVRDDFSREVLAFIYENYKTLPFCSRWIYKKFGSRGLLALKRIEDVGILHNYPRLMEAGNGKVAQAEETTLLAKDKKIITTL
ncbi:type II methionyl aminopeptidase [Candidatus Pacearchaeota archaeon]|nr:type II methionyl aminopeptidase [Candidatus Pacearchaeota archaeon]